MGVSVYNIVSEALDLLDFSTKYAIENSGMDFTYILIVWNPSKEVMNWIEEERYKQYLNGSNSKGMGFSYYRYKTNSNLGFLPNLRSCFNLGFDKSFEYNEYACGINTDMMFYFDWLRNLYKYRKENHIINCREIDPRPTIHHEVQDFGSIGYDFPVDKFYKYCTRLYKDELVSEEEWFGPRADSTPHLIHKSTWENVGPWTVNIIADVDWFNRAKSSGIKNMKSKGSIVYHEGKGETKKHLGHSGAFSEIYHRTSSS